MSEKTIAQEILILRSQRGWSQQELADRIRTTQRTVAAWEAGTSIPRKAMRVRIAGAFGLPDNYFLLGAEEEKPLQDKEVNRLLKRLDQLLTDQEISEKKKTMLIDSFSEELRLNMQNSENR